MSTEALKQAEFKQRLAATLADLQQTSKTDGEAMAILGSMAAEIIATVRQPTWTAAKNKMSAELYRGILEAFDAKGNQHVKAGRVKQAYAIQALATSLVARSQASDPEIAEGEHLLDVIIENVVVIYQRQKARLQN